MQLALTPEVLVPVGAGAVLLVIALVVVLLVLRRRRRARAQDRMTVADAVREASEPADGPPEPDDRPLPDEPDRPTDAVPQPRAGLADDEVRSEPAPSDQVGSGRTVAAAVAQALAVREARARAAAPAPADTPGENGTGPVEAEPADRPQGRGDARDRLLAVLLDDPVRAVGATVELEACRRQLDRLTDAVRHEREVLTSVLTRLVDAGLAPDQLARLSGLSDEELRSLLPARAPAS